MKKYEIYANGKVAPMTTVEADFITQNIPVESGKVAKIIIPIDANEDDLLLIKDMFDVLLKRKFQPHKINHKINPEN